MKFLMPVLLFLPLLGCAGDLGDSTPYIDALEERRAESAEPPTSTDISGELPACAQTPPAFLRDEARCAGCHNAGPSPSGGLDLASPDLASRLANVEGTCPTGLLADPTDPEASTLVIWTRDGVDQCGAPSMPPVGAPLSLEELDCLVMWIDGMDGVIDLGPGGVAP